MTEILDEDQSWDWSVNLGGSEVLVMTYRNENGTPVDITNLEVEAFALAPELVGRLEAEKINGPAGRFDIRLLATPSLKPRRRYGFRPRLIPPEGPDYAIALPLINVVAK